jgi:hypothetical protein
VQYFRFTNWGRHQHYRERRPPWFKVYTAILEPGNDCYGMPDHQVGQLIKLLALAADTGNCIPYDDNFVTSQINASEKVILRVFHNLGIITVHDTRAEVFKIESDRLASINASENASGSASKSASKNASNVASENARLRGQRTEYRDQRQRKSSGSGSSVSSGRDFGTETGSCRDERLTPPDATAAGALRENLPGTEADPEATGPEVKPAPLHGGRPAGKRRPHPGDEWLQWASDLAGQSDDDPAMVAAYVEALDAAVTARYAQTGGTFTPARRAAMVKRMEPHGPDVQLLAIEIFVDLHAGSADEKYFCGIANRLARMTAAEFNDAIEHHRLTVGDHGLAALIESRQEVASGGDQR